MDLAKVSPQGKGREEEGREGFCVIKKEKLVDLAKVSPQRVQYRNARPTSYASTLTTELGEEGKGHS